MIGDLLSHLFLHGFTGSQASEVHFLTPHSSRLGNESMLALGGGRDGCCSSLRCQPVGPKH